MDTITFTPLVCALNSAYHDPPNVLPPLIRLSVCVRTQFKLLRRQKAILTICMGNEKRLNLFTLIGIVEYWAKIVDRIECA